MAVTEESSVPKTNVIGTEEFGYKTIIQQKVYKKKNKAQENNKLCYNITVVLGFTIIIYSSLIHMKFKLFGSFASIYQIKSTWIYPNIS